MLVTSTSPLDQQSGNRRALKNGLVCGLESPGCRRIAVEHSRTSRREKSLCANDLHILLDVCGTPQIDAVERVKGTAPTTQPVDQQRISWGQLPKKASILDSKIQVGQRDGPDKSTQSRRRLPIANVPGPMRVKERAHRLAAGTTAEHAARTASSVPRARSDGAADRSSAWA